MVDRPATSLRSSFARCAIDLAHEHHSGLVRTVQGGEYSTAAALLRPLLEASTMGFWFMYVASCDQIQSLPTCLREDVKVELIPSLSKMATSLIPVFPNIKALADEFGRGGRAKWLHKYTHGDTPQLARKIDGHGWSEQDVMRNLIRADIFAILGACLGTVIEANPELSAYSFQRRDALGDELSNRFRSPGVVPQPHCLPAGLDDGCGLSLGHQRSFATT